MYCQVCSSAALAVRCKSIWKIVQQFSLSVICLFSQWAFGPASTHPPAILQVCPYLSQGQTRILILACLSRGTTKLNFESGIYDTDALTPLSLQDLVRKLQSEVHSDPDSLLKENVVANSWGTTYLAVTPSNLLKSFYVRLQAKLAVRQGVRELKETGELSVDRKECLDAEHLQRVLPTTVVSFTC